jgi:hypothetical protein
MRTETSILITGLLFAVKFGAGYWLTRSGRPYSTILLTIHKLVALAIVAMVGITIHRLRRDVGLSGIEIVATILTGLLFLLTIASGGLVSADRPANTAMLIVHRAAPFLAVLSTAATLYLVTR